MDVVTLAMAKAYSDSKGGYVRKETKEILAEINVPFNDGDGIYAYGLSITEGTSYCVLWDGQKYNCTCRKLAEEYDSVLYVGNAFVFGEVDSGEPFVVAQVLSDGKNAEFNIVGFTNENDHTCSIYQEIETIHPIDPKYIPALDFITLKGADGKQYKVAVDETGTLTATAIE